MEHKAVNALFLGPKSENYPVFKQMLGYMMDDYAEWRRGFHPDDPLVITPSDQEEEGFQATVREMRQVLVELAGLLQMTSVPWFSPRYLGHMTADTLMAANLGYMLALLYNQNNVAYEGSPGTTGLELETGRQLAAMMGYDPAQSWGHLTAGGTIANYEGLWLARNLKSIPHALRRTVPELVAGLDDWALWNLSPASILDLLEQAKQMGCFEQVRAHSVRGQGIPAGGLGKVLVPQSKHYSWVKAMDLLGLGQERLIQIPVQDDYRMDLESLRVTLEALLESHTPVLAVVAVVGTTEEGAVDGVYRIADLRDEFSKRGLSFWLHIDAAYGGYVRSAFLDAQGSFMDLPQMREELQESLSDWPSDHIYQAYQAISRSDSITVDPHKLGYIPYPAGAFLARDRRVVELISYFAAYVFEEAEDNPQLLGSYILEGSKPGAAAAAVWVAHRLVPLHWGGYGRLIGSSIGGARQFYRSLLEQPLFSANGRNYLVLPLTEPDLNIVVYAFNEQGNADLEVMNALNQRICEHGFRPTGPLLSSDFILSKTSLEQKEYRDTPLAFLRRFGIPEEEWRRVGSVFVLRSCVVTPFLARGATFETYWGTFRQSMTKALETL
ncbi:MAG: pyridoxal-dependent decarboxylase [Coprothermobacterota bacterium]|nr:pyridoxal-dependent decarboxylase [Coprothermobacterota bacterium]